MRPFLVAERSLYFIYYRPHQLIIPLAEVSNRGKKKKKKHPYSSEQVITVKANRRAHRRRIYCTRANKAEILDPRGKVFIIQWFYIDHKSMYPLDGDSAAGCGLVQT